MKIFVIVNLHKKNSKEVAITVISCLISYGAEIILSNACKQGFNGSGACFMQEEQAFIACNAVLTIGGDGTILHAAKACVKYDKPILGLNLGRMGFLATAEANEPDKLKMLVEGNYILEKRVLLNASLNGAEHREDTALNDVVISKKSINQIMDIEVFCDDILINKFRADGVVIATPTGSTAYSLSAGGPILDAQIEGLVVTPICAHSLHSPPMVFSAHRNIKVKVEDKARLSCDGALPWHITEKDIAHVSLSKRYISLISFNEASQFEAIDKKLKGR